MVTLGDLAGKKVYLENRFIDGIGTFIIRGNGRMAFIIPDKNKEGGRPSFKFYSGVKPVGLVYRGVRDGIHKIGGMLERRKLRWITPDNNNNIYDKFYDYFRQQGISL